MNKEIIDILQKGEYHYTYSESHRPIARVPVKKKVRIHCVDCFENKLVSEEQSYADICEYPYLNPQTGPVYIENAEPGDTLLVHIHEIEITREWAVSGLVPRFGLLTPTETTEMLTPLLPQTVKKMPIKDGRVWFNGFSRPVAPFMGTMGTAPSLAAINALTPAWYGGNMDCPETCPGNTIHFPVNTEGALFFCGDGHAAQGAGEIGGVACETPVNLVCSFDVIKGEKINWPRVTNNDYMMVIGSARPLEDATRIACAELIRWIVKEYKLPETETLLWLTQVLEIRIGNVCDPNYSVVAAVRKEFFEA